MRKFFEGGPSLLKRTLIGLIRSHEQTGEKATQPELKTRYYKLSRDRLWDEVVQIFKKKPGYKVLHEVKGVGEIVMEKRTMTGRVQDVTLTIFSINPIQSAIDVYSASRGSLGDLGSNYRTILDIYNTIDKKLAEYKITN
jgi:uncharacterized protein (DUF1499 family)